MSFYANSKNEGGVPEAVLEHKIYPDIVEPVSNQFS